VCTAAELQRYELALAKLQQQQQQQQQQEETAAAAAAAVRMACVIYLCLK
jgi:hypothetical protein